MSQIIDVITKIENLKISHLEMAIIYTLNNLHSYFRLYLVILSHDTREIEKLSTLSELIKTLKMNSNVFQMRIGGREIILIVLSLRKPNHMSKEEKK